MGSKEGDYNAEDLANEGSGKSDDYINNVELDEDGEPIMDQDDYYAEEQDKADEEYKNGPQE